MLKDVPCVIDDYAPSTDAHAQRKQARTAERILRGTGNLSGRSRLNANLSERPTYKPRGLLISTGEDLPPGQSILARTLTIEVEKMRINLPEFTEAQNNADELPNALAAYVEWLTPQLDEYKQSLPAMWRQHRTRFAKTASHLRIPETLAHLSIGIDLLTNFVRDRDVLNQEEIEALADRAQTTLLTLGLKHGQRVQEEDPAEVFLTTLRAMLVQGSATLIQKGTDNRPLGMVGWQDGKNALLIPVVVRQAVVRFVREAGNHFPHSPRALNESLEARGVLKKDAQGKLSRLVKIQGKNQRVLEIPMKYLAD
jgi:hypothetical protein